MLQLQVTGRKRKWTNLTLVSPNSRESEVDTYIQSYALGMVYSDPKKSYFGVWQKTRTYAHAYAYLDLECIN